MVTELQAADLLVMHAARKADAGTMVPADAAMAKLYASEMLQRVADNAVQIFGGMGLMEEMPIDGCGAILALTESGKVPQKYSATLLAVMYFPKWQG
ncbi:MAG: hypothetical protein CM1200mP41_01770 [Gammaproteobacteria bacterium]|nr:MAG: hypothetical protein CM1200mP41_01770 [Gammaproteobacteria bacterium]